MKIDRVGASLLSALADVYLHRSQAKSRGFAVKHRQLSLLRGRRIGGYWNGGLGVAEYKTSSP
jgi:hypothetical protein